MEYNTKLEIGAVISSLGAVFYPLTLVFYFFLTGIRNPEFKVILGGASILMVLIGFLIMILVDEA